jgi:hypothetical protein
VKNLDCALQDLDKDARADIRRNMIDFSSMVDGGNVDFRTGSSPKIKTVRTD